MIKKFNGKMPVVGKECLVFENSTLIGEVKLADNVSVWPYATLRADMDSITVGKGSNIQESSVIHTDIDTPTVIGDYVTIGHNAIVHGATIGDNCLIGMGSILLNGCIIEDGAVVGAGCVVKAGSVVPANHLVVGNPMRIVKELSKEECQPFIDNTNLYVDLSLKYLEEEANV